MALTAFEVKALFENSFMPGMADVLLQGFNAADAALLQLAMEANTNAEQNRHFEAVQSLRIEKRSIIENFGRVFLQKDDQAGKTAVDPQHMANLRKLLAIDLDNWRANTGLVAAYRDLDTRLHTIDGSLENPFHPSHVVESYLQSLSVSSLDMQIKLMLLRLFEGRLYSKLENYVRIANDVLIEHDILPDLETQPADIDVSINALVDDVMGNSSQLPINAEQEHLENALADLQANDIEHIDQLLGAHIIKQDPAQLKVRDLIVELQNQHMLEPNISEAMSLQLEKIQLVARLFDYMMRDESLPYEAKALLIHLQLPYARVALNDAEMLQNSQHPARVLLNQINESVVGWQPGADALAADRLYLLLRDTVQYFMEIERVSTINYQEYLFRYLAYAEGERQKNAQITRRILDVQLGADIADTVRETVNGVLDKKMGERKIPGAVKRILQEGWSHVLYITALQKGLAAAEFQQDLSVVDELIKSVSPSGQFASRAEFARQLPPLLNKLRLGLSQINISFALINQMLCDLEEEHKRIIVGIKGDFSDLESIAEFRLQQASQAYAKENDEAHKEEEHTAIVRSVYMYTQEQVQELAEQAVQIVRSAAKNIFSANTQKLMETLGPGVMLMWMRDTKIRCRIAAHIKHAKKFVITDRAGVKLAELSEYEMAQKIDCGEIEIIVGEPLFDRALESVIGGIRDRR